MYHPMPKPREVIAIAGLGDLGKYIAEELLASPEFGVIVLSRSSSNPWCTLHAIPTFQTTYHPSSLLPILNSTKCTTLISTISDPHPTYLTTHLSLLEACQRSETCKRLIPSEWAGDSEEWPGKPAYYKETREPFRVVLERQYGEHMRGKRGEGNGSGEGVEWTCVGVGWLGDYWLGGCKGESGRGKTYMSAIGNKWVVDWDRWRACVRGTGDEIQSWVCGRDVGRGVIELCRAPKGMWESYTYMAGEWNTFNEAIKILEKHHEREIPITYKSLEQIQEEMSGAKDFEALEAAQVEEMMVLGCLAVPREKTLRQREVFFKGIKFRGLRELLEDAKKMDLI